MELTPADTAGEETQLHFGLFLLEAGAEVLVGSLVAAPLGDTPRAVRLRQVVVDADRRGQGLGRQLLLEAEQLLHTAAWQQCHLYARVEAMGFYRACGYSATDETIQLIGMPHHGMRKSLG